jgi:hypothetical protein
MILDRFLMGGPERLRRAYRQTIEENQVLADQHGRSTHGVIRRFNHPTPNQGT